MRKMKSRKGGEQIRQVRQRKHEWDLYILQQHPVLEDGNSHGFLVLGHFVSSLVQWNRFVQDQRSLQSRECAFGLLGVQ